MQGLLENIGIDVILTRAFQEQNLGTDVNSSLRKRVDTSNFHNCDLFVSVHCNAGGGTGTEVLVIKKGGKAEEFAKKVLNKITQELSTYNRGVKEANLYVLRETNCPAILIETAFIDNENDAQILKTRYNDIAEAIVEGIIGKELTKEITEINEIVSELANRGIITNKELWLEKLKVDKDVYWLAMKTANYVKLEVK